MAASLKMRLTHIKYLLLIAMAILVTAEIAYLLQNVLGSILGIVLTLLVFLAHGFAGHFFKKSVWSQAIALILRLLLILAPLIYLLVQIFVFNSKALWLQLLLVLSFVVPLLLMLYAYRLVQQLQDEMPD